MSVQAAMQAMWRIEREAPDEQTARERLLEVATEANYRVAQLTPAMTQQITECIHRLNQGETRADLIADGMACAAVDAAIVARSERAQKENER